MDTIETVKVVNDKTPTGYMIINKSEFKEGNHELYDDKGLGNPSDTPLGMNPDGKNPSGTFSTPTPTDIRYPNKDHTEFENNHGAFIGKSAAGLRKEQGLPDKPGGLSPVNSDEIPEDWQTQSPRERKRLANKLRGTTNDEMSLTEADAIIKGRLDNSNDPKNAMVDNTVVDNTVVDNPDTLFGTKTDSVFSSKKGV